jgi:hypothetical protein
MGENVRQALRMKTPSDRNNLVRPVIGLRCALAGLPRVHEDREENEVE